LYEFKVIILRNMTPCSLVDRNQASEVSAASIFKPEVMREAESSSETLAQIYQIKQRHIPEAQNLKF
jgi:hypothetical protein